MNKLLLIFALLSSVILGGCATTGATDPYESTNRKFYKFNDSIDKKLIEPAAKKYVAVTPAALRNSVTNFFDNLTYLNTIANDALQGKPGDFFDDSSRFFINSTIGVAGLFDPATKMGFSRRNEDLGQTLGKWGVAEGAYLTLPFLGPSSFRNLSSPLTEILLNPLTYMTVAPIITVPLGLLSAVNTRADLLEATRIRDQVALDPYVFVREAWLQQREFDVHDGKPPEDDFDEFFEQNNPDDPLLKVY